MDQAERTAVPPRILDVQRLMSSSPSSSVYKSDGNSTQAESRSPADSFNRHKVDHVVCEESQSSILTEHSSSRKDQLISVFVMGFAALVLFVLATAGMLLFQVLPSVPTELPPESTTTMQRKYLPGKITEWNGFEYIFYKLEKQWETAQADCVLWGGDLVSIHSEEENKFINSLQQGNCNKEKCPDGDCYPTIPCNRWNWWVWIGLNDEDNEGGFVWTDATANNFSAWDTTVQPQQPNNGAPGQTVENCVVQSDFDGGWYDKQCEESFYSICKRPNF